MHPRMHDNDNVHDTTTTTLPCVNMTTSTMGRPWPMPWRHDGDDEVDDEDDEWDEGDDDKEEEAGGHDEGC